VIEVELHLGSKEVFKHNYHLMGLKVQKTLIFFPTYKLRTVNDFNQFCILQYHDCYKWNLQPNIYYSTLKKHLIDHIIITPMIKIIVRPKPVSGKGNECFLNV